MGLARSSQRWLAIPRDLYDGERGTYSTGAGDGYRMDTYDLGRYYTKELYRDLR